MVGACVWSGCQSTDPVARPVRIYAAASTTDALTEALQTFRAAGGPAAETVVGASSAMARQIEEGAPADLFLSANIEWMDHLDKAGHVGTNTRTNLLSNRLVVVVPVDNPANVDLHPGGNLDALVGDGYLAIGDPAHVPAGQYAQAALTWMGCWPHHEAKTAQAMDVRAALLLVEQGEAAAGIVYATDAAASSRVRIAGTFPEEAHPAIRYPLAVLRHQGELPGVRAVYDFLRTDEAHAIFARHGFSRPPE